VSFAVEVFPTETYPRAAAERIEGALVEAATLVVTGGTTAARIYPQLTLPGSVRDVFFSDERCVPPDHDESNFRMVTEAMPALTADVHRMRGELDPSTAASAYHDQVAPFVTGGFDVMLLGMGADCHIGAMFPGSPALDEARFAAAVDRPDGMKGVTLTPPAMLAADTILLLVTGQGKADAVARVVQGAEPPESCPARLLVDHTDATFLLDEGAAGSLG